MGVEAKTLGEWVVRCDGSFQSASGREDDGPELEVRVRGTVILSATALVICRSFERRAKREEVVEGEVKAVGKVWRVN